MSTLLNYGNNIYTRPDTIRKICINSKSISFIKEVKRHALTICRNEISESYINKTCKTFTNGYVYIRENNILGFILWKLQIHKQDEQKNTELLPSKSLFIQLLCAEKTGTDFGYSMLSDVETYCVNTSIPTMSLEPGNTKLETYYHEYGFKLLCRYPKKIMTKPILELLTIPQNRAKTRKIRQNTLTTHDRQLIQYLSENGSKLEADINYTLFNT